MRSQPLERQLPVNSEAVWKSVVSYLIGVAALVYLILSGVLEYRCDTGLGTAAHRYGPPCFQACVDESCANTDRAQHLPGVFKFLSPKTTNHLHCQWFRA